MNADLYAAWHTAGDNLQHVGVWLAGDGAWLPILAVAAVIVWRTWRIRPRDDYRTRNDRKEAAWTVVRGERPEPAEPGTNEDDLLTCLQIMRATDSARKEKP